jgi:hypothetical protein
MISASDLATNQPGETESGAEGDSARAAQNAILNSSASRASGSHKAAGRILRHPALVIGNPGFRYFLGGEACHQRRVTARHDDFDPVGRVFLNNDPVGSAGMRMFFCHRSHMVFGYGKAIKGARRLG